MSGLLIQNAYVPKSNKAVTPESVLKEAREAADKETKAMGTTAAPAFIHHSDHKRRQTGATWRHKQ